MTNSTPVALQTLPTLRDRDQETSKGTRKGSKGTAAIRTPLHQTHPKFLDRGRPSPFFKFRPLSLAGVLPCPSRLIAPGLLLAHTLLPVYKAAPTSQNSPFLPSLASCQCAQPPPTAQHPPASCTTPEDWTDRIVQALPETQPSKPCPRL